MASKTKRANGRRWAIVAATATAAAWFVSRVKRVFAGPPTAKELRIAEKARRKGIRRNLRGLKKAA